MITWAELAVFQQWRQPERAYPQFLQVIELLLDSREGPTLVIAPRLIPRLMVGRGSRIIEAIHHHEIDPGIAPVHGRRKRRQHFNGAVSHIHESGFWCVRLVQCDLYFAIPDRIRHTMLLFLSYATKSRDRSMYTNAG